MYRRAMMLLLLAAIECRLGQDRQSSCPRFLGSSSSTWCCSQRSPARCVRGEGACSSSSSSTLCFSSVGSATEYWPERERG
jgi:hypothetical protein